MWTFPVCFASFDVFFLLFSAHLDTAEHPILETTTQESFTMTTTAYSSILIKARPDDTGTDFICQAESPALASPSAASVLMNVSCKILLYLVIFFNSDFRICRNKCPGRLIFRSNRENFQNPSKSIGFVYSPLWKIPHQNPSVLCTPPFENSPIKIHRFCVLPPLKTHPSKAHRFCVLPPLKNHPSSPSVLCTAPFEKIIHQTQLVLCTPPFEKSQKFYFDFIVPPVPPATPVIQGAEGHRMGVRENTRDFSLVCSTAGGNPVPSVTWFRNDVQVESQSMRIGTHGMKAVLTIEPTARDNNVTFKCEAVSPMMPRGTSSQVVLDVLCKCAQFGLFGEKISAKKAPAIIYNFSKKHPWRFSQSDLLRPSSSTPDRLLTRNRTAVSGFPANQSPAIRPPTFPGRSTMSLTLRKAVIRSRCQTQKVPQIDHSNPMLSSVDWLIDKIKLLLQVIRLIDWLIESRIDSLSDWLIDWSIDWLIDWSIGWLIDRLVDRLIDWLIKSSFFYTSFVWSIDWLIESRIDSLIEWLIDWLGLVLVVHRSFFLGAFVTTTNITINVPAGNLRDISVTCQATNPKTKETKRSTGVIAVEQPAVDVPYTVGLPTPSSEIAVLDENNNVVDPSNVTFADVDGAAFIGGTRPENLTMVIAISASVGGAVFCALLACLIYVMIRGKAKKFEGTEIRFDFSVYFQSEVVRSGQEWPGVVRSGQEWPGTNPSFSKHFQVVFCSFFRSFIVSFPWVFILECFLLCRNGQQR